MSTARQPLQVAFNQLRADQLSVHTFSALARNQSLLLDFLPSRFGEVLHQLLDPLESGALFTEERCSFSQRDLRQSVQTWPDRARERLAKGGAE
jgi:hypothetical protein